jgi:group I intron endonuclease
MTIYSIYRVKNKINDEIYIGYTKNFEFRYKRHLYDYKKTNKLPHFYRALNFYGFKNFQWDIIYQSKDGKHCLEIMEPKFIKEYDSYHNGYNCTIGGDGTTSKVGNSSSEKMKEIWKDPNSTHRKRIEYLKQEKIKTKKETYSKKFSITFPDGHSEIIQGIKKFCRDNFLDYSQVKGVMNGKYKQCKGFIIHRI